MNQQHEEMLSALFDEQCSEFEMRRVLGAMSTDDIQQLRRYQLMRDVMQKKAGALHCTMDISAAVAEAIDNENVQSPLQKPSKVSRIKPLIGFATAASVAFVAVLAVQQWRYIDSASDHGFVADGNVSASQIPLASSPGLSKASAVSTLPADNRAILLEKSEQSVKNDKTKDGPLANAEP